MHGPYFRLIRHQLLYFGRYKNEMVQLFFPESADEKEKLLIKLEEYLDYIRTLEKMDDISHDTATRKVLINSDVELEVPGHSDRLQFKVCLPVYENIQINHISFTSRTGSELLLKEKNDKVNLNLNGEDTTGQIRAISLT